MTELYNLRTNKELKTNKTSWLVQHKNKNNDVVAICLAILYAL